MSTSAIVPHGSVYWIEAIAKDGTRQPIEGFETEAAAFRRLRVLQAKAGIGDRRTAPSASGALRRSPLRFSPSLLPNRAREAARRSGATVAPWDHSFPSVTCTSRRPSRTATGTGSQHRTWTL
jgi:hypothetical protein